MSSYSDDSLGFEQAVHIFSINGDDEAPTSGLGEITTSTQLLPTPPLHTSDVHDFTVETTTSSEVVIEDDSTRLSLLVARCVDQGICTRNATLEPVDQTFYGLGYPGQESSGRWICESCRFTCEENRDREFGRVLIQVSEERRRPAVCRCTQCESSSGEFRKSSIGVDLDAKRAALITRKMEVEERARIKEYLSSAKTNAETDAERCVLCSIILLFVFPLGLMCWTPMFVSLLMLAVEGFTFASEGLQSWIPVFGFAMLESLCFFCFLCWLWCMTLFSKENGSDYCNGTAECEDDLCYILCEEPHLRFFAWIELCGCCCGMCGIFVSSVVLLSVFSFTQTDSVRNWIIVSLVLVSLQICCCCCCCCMLPYLANCYGAVFQTVRESACWKRLADETTCLSCKNCLKGGLRALRSQRCQANVCRRFVHKELQLKKSHFAEVKCYCTRCWEARGEGDWGTRHRTNGRFANPRLWTRFALKDPGVVVGGSYDWNTAYHGTSVRSAKAIVECGEMRMPGDPHPDGGTIEIVRGHIDAQAFARNVFMSPSIAYAASPCYCKEVVVGKGVYRVALELRVKPGSYKIGPETLGAGRMTIDKLFSNDTIEWFTNKRGVIQVVALLVKVSDLKNESTLWTSTDNDKSGMESSLTAPLVPSETQSDFDGRFSQWMDV